MSREVIDRIISLLLAVFCTILVLWKIFGNSPTLSQLMLLTFMYFTYKIQSIKTESRFNKKYNKEKFDIIEKRFDENSKDFKEIKQEIQNINIKLSKIDYLLDDMKLIKRKLFKEHPQ